MRSVRVLLRVPDFAALAGGYAELPRGGRLVVAGLIILALMSTGIIIALT